jgi:hypothetical protein
MIGYYTANTSLTLTCVRVNANDNAPPETRLKAERCFHDIHVSLAAKRSAECLFLSRLISRTVRAIEVIT